MRFRPNRRSSRGPSAVVFSTDCPFVPSFETATEDDLAALAAARDHYQRQVRWNRRSMVVGLVLGAIGLAATVFAPLPPGCRPWMIAIAVLELGFLPVYLTAARRWLGRLIELISIDLGEGDIANRAGRVRRLFGAGRVVQDLRTRRIRTAPPGFVGLAGFQTGAVVDCRFAVRSGVLLTAKRPSGVDFRSLTRRSERCVAESWCSPGGFDFDHAEIELTTPRATPYHEGASILI